VGVRGAEPGSLNGFYLRRGGPPPKVPRGNRAIPPGRFGAALADSDEGGVKQSTFCMARQKIMITMGSPYFVLINANEMISSWYLLGAGCVTPPPPTADQVRLKRALQKLKTLNALGVGMASAMRQLPDAGALQVHTSRFGQPTQHISQATQRLGCRCHGCPPAASASAR
jgi:hypothetical protein